ncbi:hypothetical protein ACFLRA_04030, partial [Bdellovibrionota bacterium]
ADGVECYKFHPSDQFTSSHIGASEGFYLRKSENEDLYTATVNVNGSIGGPRISINIGNLKCKFLESSPLNFYCNSSAPDFTEFWSEIMIDSPYLHQVHPDHKDRTKAVARNRSLQDGSLEFSYVIQYRNIKYRNSRRTLILGKAEKQIIGSGLSFSSNDCETTLGF